MDPENTPEAHVFLPQISFLLPDPDSVYLYCGNLFLESLLTSQKYIFTPTYSFLFHALKHINIVLHIFKHYI